MTRSESQGSNGGGTFAGSVPGTGIMTMSNATITNMASLMQRVMLDRPVVDQSGLTGRYNIALKWAPDETHPNEPQARRASRSRSSTRPHDRLPGATRHEIRINKSACPWRLDKVTRRWESGITLDSALATGRKRSSSVM